MDTYCREAAAATVASGSRLRPVFGLADDQVTDAAVHAPALLEIVLQKFSSTTTRTTVPQNWVKGRRAEVQEINGTVIRALRAVGLEAPANARTNEFALRIEAGELETTVDNIDLLLGSAVVSCCQFRHRGTRSVTDHDHEGRLSG